MEKIPKISVICTVKNGESTLKATIQSVKEQTFENWEMVIVDDGSTDNTIRMIKKMSEEDNRIKYYLSGGIGRGRALNKAIDIAKGSYITILDADDAIHPDKFKIQLESFSQNKVFLVCTEAYFIFNDEKPNWEKYNDNENKETAIGDKILRNNIIRHSSVMMDKRWFYEIGQYNVNRTSQLDYELWLRAFEKKAPMLKLNKILTAKRIHSNQSFENKKRFQYLYNSATLQLKYNLKLGKNYYLLLVFPLRMVLGMLPFEKRLAIKKILKLN